MRNLPPIIIDLCTPVACLYLVTFFIAMTKYQTAVTWSGKHLFWLMVGSSVAAKARQWKMLYLWQQEGAGEQAGHIASSIRKQRSRETAVLQEEMEHLLISTSSGAPSIRKHRDREMALLISVLSGTWAMPLIFRLDLPSLGKPPWKLDSHQADNQECTRWHSQGMCAQILVSLNFWLFTWWSSVSGYQLKEMPCW